MSRTVWMLLEAAVAGPLLYWLFPWFAARLAVGREAARGRAVTNYRGVPVRLGLGWAWLAWGVAASLPAVAGARHPGGQVDLGVLVAGTAMLGWLDDRHGSGAARGFRGHLRELARGHVTTGLLKLGGITGLALAIAFALPSARVDTPAGDAGRIGVWLLCAAVIAMAANLVNLLDLRPGRALKAYVVLALPAYLPLAVAGMRPGWSRSPLLVAMLALGSVLVLGPALACWRADLGERAMLGDMGANAAGALAGWMVARAMPLPALAAAAAVLLALNLASEKVSFSGVIEGSAALRWVDGLGRAGRTGVEEGASAGDIGS